MKHVTLPRFWEHYRQLPREVQELADKSFELLKADPHHPSLHFKNIGGQSSYGQYVLALTTEPWV